MSRAKVDDYERTREVQISGTHPVHVNKEKVRRLTSLASVEFGEEILVC